MRVQPGHVIGAGLGGFIDGIVLHQILQWHNMASAVLPPLTMDAMHQNMVWDGLFHAPMWLVTLARLGIPLRRRCGRHRARRGLVNP